jgi:hypothetical protein
LSSPLKYRPTHQALRACVIAFALARTGFSIEGQAQAQTPAPASPAASRQDELRRARQHFEDGKKAFEAKDYPTALKEFRAGYEIEPRPGFLLNMGHAAQKTGDLAAAKELYGRFLQTNPTGEERRVAEASIADIDRKLGTGAAGASSSAPATPSVTAPTSTGATGVPTVPPGESASSLDGAQADGQGSNKAPAPPPAPDPGAGPGPMVVVAPPLAPGPASPVSDETKPIYAKWWFWTGLGVVALGAAAILVFAAKGSDNGSHDNGSWGQIKL